MARKLLWLVSFLVATSAMAAPRIVLGDIKGDKKAAVSKQLRQSLCSTYECVALPKVATKRKVDWRKMKRAGAVASITGAAGKVKRGPGVVLEVNVGPGAATQRWQFPLVGGKLNAKALGQIQSDLDSLLAGAPSAPATPPATPDTTPPPSTPDSAINPANEVNPNAPSTSPSSTPSEPTSSSEHTSSTATTSGEAAPAAPSGTVRKPSVFSAELGADFLNRNLKYSSLESANLRTYTAPLLVAPHAHVEGFPLAPFADNLAAGIGIEADAAIAVGLKSAVSGGLSHPTQYGRYDFALLWRAPVGSVFTIIPKVGYRVSNFKVNAASDGSTFNGLPDLTDNGLRLGAGVEAAFGEHEAIVVFLNADYMPSVSGKDLISAVYFPKGKESGFNGELGVGVHIIAGFSLRAAFMYQMYSYSFTTTDGDVYIAKGATDTYIGGRVMARYSF